MRNVTGIDEYVKNNPAKYPSKKAKPVVAKTAPVQNVLAKPAPPLPPSAFGKFGQKKK